MKRILCCTLSLLFCLPATFAAEPSGIRVRVDLNAGWRFLLEDAPEACGVGYDDSAWRVLDLPHDWAFENGYDEQGAQAANGGYACGGVGWYRKAFDLTAADCASRRIRVDFDAVYMNSEVWINGHYLGKRPYGYISFGYELTPYVKAGRNLLCVRVDNSREPSARWYHGCGIYGNVTLSLLPPVHFKKWGVTVAVSDCDALRALLEVSAEADLPAPGPSLSVEYVIRDPAGREVGRTGRTALEPGGRSAAARIEIASPRLWSPDTPERYTLTARLYVDDELSDCVTERFGIRTVRWDGATGCWLNGRNVKIRGVCEHLEGGPVGAAWTENLMRWKIRLLKEMGCNAIRTAHNPQLPLFYDLCDEMGMLVLDEIFDGWGGKAAEDYGRQAFAGWWERDLRDWIRRDRNHPSVIAYSVGNETQGDVAQDLVRVCHEEDPTRAVTSGHSGSEYMDLFGVNGSSEKRSFVENYTVTDRAFVGTENPHTWQVRGYYRTQTWYRDGFSEKKGVYGIPDLTPRELFHYEWAAPEAWANGKQHFNSSYDNATVRVNVRRSLELLRDKPWYAASFRWTGFDYVGEAGYVHGGWPFRAFMGGVLDLAGFKKDHYYLYQSQWTRKPMIHMLPHWTHPDLAPGEPVPVWVYTTGDTVELFFNGRSLGRRHRGERWDEMQCEWMVPWKEGVLEAVAYAGGREIARTRQQTAGAPAALRLEIRDASLTGSPEDLHIVDIAQVDRRGVIYPYGENRVHWALVGDGEVFAAENGNPVDVETVWHAASRRAFFGLLRLFVRNEDRQGVSLYAAAILGDKRLKCDDRIRIDVRGIDLEGNSLALPACEIRYTTDGSDPTHSGKRYAGPFRLRKGGTVRAVVRIAGAEPMLLEERFGPGEGIYWGTPGVSEALLDIQAEGCRMEHATLATAVPGYQAGGYAAMGRNASLAFYQENDGAETPVEMICRFVPLEPGEVCLVLSNNGVKAGEVRVPVGAGETGRWRTCRLKVVLKAGANALEVVSAGSPRIGVDAFGFTESGNGGAAPNKQ